MVAPEPYALLLSLATAVLFLATPHVCAASGSCRMGLSGCHSNDSALSSVSIGAFIEQASQLVVAVGRSGGKHDSVLLNSIE